MIPWPAQMYPTVSSYDCSKISIQMCCLYFIFYIRTVKLHTDWPHDEIRSSKHFKKSSTRNDQHARLYLMIVTIFRAVGGYYRHLPILPICVPSHQEISKSKLEIENVISLFHTLVRLKCFNPNKKPDSKFTKSSIKKILLENPTERAEYLSRRFSIANCQFGVFVSHHPKWMSTCSIKGKRIRRMLLHMNELGSLSHENNNGGIVAVENVYEQHRNNNEWEFNGEWMSVISKCAVEQRISGKKMVNDSLSMKLMPNWLR